jgi:hypothetical protein
MEYEEIRNLPEKEFYKLANSQCEQCPDLLNILIEDEVIDSFYEYYKRKRVKK